MWIEKKENSSGYIQFQLQEFSLEVVSLEPWVHKQCPARAFLIPPCSISFPLHPPTTAHHFCGQKLLICWIPLTGGNPDHVASPWGAKIRSGHPIEENSEEKYPKGESKPMYVHMLRVHMANAKFKGKSRLQRGNQVRGQDPGGNGRRAESDQEVSEVMPGGGPASHWPRWLIHLGYQAHGWRWLAERYRTGATIDCFWKLLIICSFNCHLFKL